MHQCRRNQFKIFFEVHPPTIKSKLRRQPNLANPWTESYEPQQASPFQELSPGTRRYLNPENLRESSVFDHLFTENIWDLFVTQINTYHVQSVASEPDKHN